MERQLPMLRADEHCPKCRTLGPALKWSAEPENTDHLMALPDRPLTVERMDVTCWRCGYAWVRLPMDTGLTP